MCCHMIFIYFNPYSNSYITKCFSLCQRTDNSALGSFQFTKLSIFFYKISASSWNCSALILPQLNEPVRGVSLVLLTDCRYIIFDSVVVTQRDCSQGQSCTLNWLRDTLTISMACPAYLICDCSQQMGEWKKPSFSAPQFVAQEW